MFQWRESFWELRGFSSWVIPGILSAVTAASEPVNSPSPETLPEQILPVRDPRKLL